MAVRKIAKKKAGKRRSGPPAKPATSDSPGEAGPVPPDDPLQLIVDGLSYRLDRPPTRPGRLVVRAEPTDPDDGRRVVDAGDLLSFRGRQRLAMNIGQALGRQTDQVLGHLTVLLDQAERTDREPAGVVLTPARHRAAERLLARPGLLDAAARAFEALGYVGEDRAKRLVFLVGVSRLLSRPLSALLLAPSASGKSQLLDTLVGLLPEEAVLHLSRLTRAALFHATDLRHKVVVVDEQVGTSEADYALRTLQTQGKLRQLTAAGGRCDTTQAHGPIAFLSSTTSANLNPENLSRCLELPLDDSPEQTRRILEAQRRAWAGVPIDTDHAQVWRDAQSLLEPADVVIPFAERLTFPVRATNARRDQPKLLGLVAAHALLHQRRRARDDHGRLVAVVDDYRAIHPLVAPLVEESVQDLSPRAAALYRTLVDRGREPVTRHDVMALLSTTYPSARRALDELSAQELVEEVGHEKPRRFRVIETGLLSGGERLTPPDDLDA